MEETPGFSPALILSARKVTVLCFILPQAHHSAGSITWDFFLLQGDATGISDAPVLISYLSSRGVLALSPQLQKEVVMYAFCHPSSRGTVPCIHLPPLLEERGPRGTGEGAGTSALLPISSEGIVSRGLAGQACIWSPGTDEQWHHLPSVPVSQLDLLSNSFPSRPREVLGSRVRDADWPSKQ